jgi:serine/threonine-protein kinase
VVTPVSSEPTVPGTSIGLAPGVSFGSYVVRQLIGRGGMASVYRAEHLLLNKPVALKVMDRSLLATSGARQRFVLEGRAAAAIKHPNVVDITDVGVHDDVPFLVMELLTGEDLDAYLKRRGPIDEAETVRLALPIIAALNAAHASGVIHRDIKPSNIFLSQGPDDQIVPKMLDFGISKVMSDSSSQELSLTPHHQVMGTPRYLPPEALHGARELGPAADQFSLGVVLYECVTGSTPFAGETLVALLNALSAGGFRPPRSLNPAVSVGLDRVIMRALSPHPHERFPTIREMGRALLELAAERTQMVWGHSFKSPGEDGSARTHRAPPTEPIDRREQLGWRRYRRFAFGAGFISLGALASALVSAFVDSSRSIEKLPEAVRQVPTVSVAALAPVEVRPVPAPPAPRAGGDDPAAREDAASARRQTRSQTRRSASGRVSRRNERGAESRRVPEASQAGAPSATSTPAAAPAAPNPAAPATASTAPAAPDERATGAARAPASANERTPSSARRGANRSPMLD